MMPCVPPRELMWLGLFAVAACSAMLPDQIRSLAINPSRGAIQMTGQPNWHELTGFQRDLLKSIIQLSRTNDSVSGQAILKELEAEHNTDVNHGRLYPNLDTLIDHGLVEKGTIDQRTNDYAPTDGARELVRRELQSWMGVVETDQPLAGAIGQ